MFCCLIYILKQNKNVGSYIRSSALQKISVPSCILIQWTLLHSLDETDINIPEPLQMAISNTDR